MGKETNTLTMPQNHALINYIVSDYTNSGLNDFEFAEEASKELGFPVNKGHIAVRRHEFGIESNVNQPTVFKKLSTEARIKELEIQVSSLWGVLKDMLVKQNI
jgi:hypothetical protein